MFSRAKSNLSVNTVFVNRHDRKVNKRNLLFLLTTLLVIAACSGSSPSASSPSTVVSSSIAVEETDSQIPYEKELLSGEPFNILIKDGKVPEIPSAIPGFTLYSGVDKSGKSGAIKSETIRVFAGEAYPTLVYDFPWQGNNCGDAIWVLRWTTENPDVLISATNEVDNYGNVLGIADNPWGTQWATSGIMSNYICLQPGFRFAGTLDGNNSNLGDISLEWSFFDTDYFSTD